MSKVLPASEKNRDGWTRGKSVVDGVLQYLSPSAMTTADSAQGGCLRKWHWRKVSGKEEPTSKSQKKGVELHAEIETYLKTGKKVFSLATLAGAEYIPEPGRDLLVEHSIDGPVVDPEGLEVSAEAVKDPNNARLFESGLWHHKPGLLTIGSVPIVGFIDLVSLRGTTRLEHDDVTDPKGTIEVVDWKTTGNMGFAKSGSELAKSTQMVTYGEWAARKFGCEWVRLSHVYFGTKKRESTKSSILVRRSDITKRWNGLQTVVSSVLTAAQIADSNAVPANTKACDAYGGCPHRAYCTAGQAKSLEDFFGPIGAGQVKGESMSLLSKIKLPQANPAVEAEKTALKREQALASLPAGFAAAVLVVEEAGMGFPTLARGAAKAWAVLKNRTVPGADERVAGQPQSDIEPGLLALLLFEPAEIIQLATELTDALVDADVENTRADSATEGTDEPDSSALPALLPPDAPAPEKRRRRTKAEMEAARAAEMATTVFESGVVVTEQPFVTTTATQAQVEQTVNAAVPCDVSAAGHCWPHSQWADGTATGISVFVDCIPSVPFTSLDGWVDAQAAALARQAGMIDIRMAPKDSILAYGGWRGALAALVREAPPAPGTYVLFTRSELAEVAADALRSVATLFVQGVRR